MIPRCQLGKGITGVTRYVLGEGKGAGNDNLAPDEESRVDWIGGTGFGFSINSRTDAELGRKMMEFIALNQSSPTRKCEKDALHLSLAWRPGEQPTREQMEEAARGALKAMGMENAMALFVAHNDESYAHVHIIASKINPDTDRAYDLKGNYLKLSRWAEQYERDFSGSIICLRREEANRLRDAIAKRDAGAVLDHMTEKRATFTAKELTRMLAKEIKSDFSRTQFGEKVLEHKNAIRLSDDPKGPVTRYTSAAVFEAERYALRAADGLSRNNKHGVSESTRAGILQRFEKQKTGLSSEQAKAFGYATGSEGLALIDGQAGTGKSHTMSAIRQAYEANGYTVIGLAPTNAVVSDMRTDGFRNANTIHAELMALNNDRKAWSPKTVVMVDEAAMVDTRIMAVLTAHANHSGAKLILVGDDRQLSSIERGGMFGAMKDRHGAAALTEVRRQYKDEDRRAASMMAEGNFHDALAIYEAKGAIKWNRTQNLARADLVGAWAADSREAPDKSRFVFAYTNDDVDRLNGELRAVRKGRGELGKDHSFETKHGKFAFAENDRIQLTGTDKRQGLFNGTVGTITGIDGDDITVKFDGRTGRTVTFDADTFHDFRHGYAGTIYKGQGRTLDQTYLYHSEHWRSAASYVAMTRHRDKAEMFVATNTAPNLQRLARQMARVDDRRAASQFFTKRTPDTDSVLTPKELAARLNLKFHVLPERPFVPAHDGGMVAQQTQALNLAKRGPQRYNVKEAEAEPSQKPTQPKQTDAAKPETEQEARIRAFEEKLNRSFSRDRGGGRSR